MRNNRRLGIFFLLAAFIISSCTDIGLPTEYSGAVLPTRNAPVETVSPTATATPEMEKTSLPGQTVKIGYLLPLTGPLAYIGEGYQMGIDLALKEIHSEIDGVPITAIPADTGGTPQGTKTAFMSLTGKSGLTVVIGPGTSPETLAILPAIREGQVPVLDATSTDPAILSQVRENNNPWYFRLNPDEHIVAKAFSAEISKTNSSIAVISEDNPFSRSVAANYVDQFKADGLSIIREEYLPATTTEFRPLLFQLRQSRPDALFLVMQEDSCAMLMRQYTNSFTKIPVYSRGACTSNLFRQVTQDDLTIGANITEAVIFSEMQDPALSQEFEKEYKQPLTGHRMAGYYTMKYAVIPAIKSIIGSGGTISPESMQKALERLKVNTPIGLLTFDRDHQAYLSAGLITNDAGKAKLIASLPVN
jgi:branched-chain amino acid transport system substrate-binding protein